MSFSRPGGKPRPLATEGVRPRRTARLQRHEPAQRFSSGLREFQPCPSLFQQPPSFQALDRNPVHLSLEKLAFSDVFQRQLLRRAQACLG